MNYSDVQFQIVEAPAVMEGSADGRAAGHVTLGLARNADGVILMVDLSRDPVEQLELVLDELEKSRVLVNKPSGHVDIERRHAGSALRIILVGKLLDCSMQDVEDLLRSYKLNDAIVKISGDIRLDDVEDAIFETTTYKPAVIVVTWIRMTPLNALPAQGLSASVFVHRLFLKKAKTKNRKSLMLSLVRDVASA